MRQDVISLNSDNINRYNILFPITTLEANLKQTFRDGISSCIGHDIHRAYGLIYPRGLFFEPKITRLLGINLIPENAEDQKIINTRHQYNMMSRIKEGFEKDGDKLLALVEKSIIGNWFKVEPSCVAIHNTGIAARHFSVLFSLKDDAGLIAINELLKDFTYIGEGVFKHKFSECCIFAHSYFRRSQSVYNNFHFYFLNELLSLSGIDEIHTKICLDEDLIGYTPSYLPAMELEYHWGPLFNDDISAIRNGVTRYECDETERIFSGILSTEFYWKTDGSEKTFELEEMKENPTPVNQVETYHCRYMHSIYNTDLQTFVHFDGAIRSYGIDEMYERLGLSFLTFGRRAEYKKLFRIDGRLPIHLWKLLVIHYMQDNPLIYEYFGVGTERNAQKIHSKVLEPVYEYLPFAIEKKDGIRLYVTYHPLTDKLIEGRYIEILDNVTTEAGSQNAVEHFVYEIKKSLMHLGEDLEIPADTWVLKPYDRFINVPSIMHHGAQAKDLLDKTITAFINLFRAMQEHKKDFDLSITFAFVIEDRLVRISTYGQLDNLVEWMSKNMPCPITSSDFTKWIESQRNYISAFEYSPDRPLITSLAKPDGVIYIKRKPVEFKYSFYEDEEGLKYEIELSATNAVEKLLQEGLIEPCMLAHIRAMSWSDTGESYFDGPRSKWLDDNSEAAVQITDAAALSLFWSKK